MPAVQADWNVLDYHREKPKSLVVCAVKHLPKIEVNVYREIASTGDQQVLLEGQLDYLL
jgi:hypothetical protein